jgi:esterase/lipase superfamily enzyme
MVPLRHMGCVIALALAACATPPPTPAPAPEPADEALRMRSLRSDAPCPAEFSGTCYPVWFGTNRKPLDANDPSQGFGSEFDDSLHFGKRFVRIPAGHRAGELGSPLWKRLLTGVDDRLTLEPATALSEDAFAREVRAFLAGLDPADRNVLVFIHGFNTTFDEAARRAAQLGFDLKVPGITAFYSWPSRGNMSAYLNDVSSIEASEEHIAEFLVKASELAGPGKVHIIAHSMGNRGLLRAMHRATTQAALRSGTRFGQIFLAAPDVDIKLFRQLAGIYPRISERTTLYVADQDRALAALEWLSEDVRVGGAPPVLVLPGIDTVRVHGSGLFRLGHSYVAEELDVLRDIGAQLHFNEAPERRRARYGWPVPDAAGGGGWVIGK